MADKEEHTHKRYYHASRGRGGQNRVYPHLGVRDLREIIDRKRSEREHIGVSTFVGWNHIIKLLLFIRTLLFLMIPLIII
jgi:hypothetical protein